MLRPMQAVDWAAKFSGAHPRALDLMARMLQFQPGQAHDRGAGSRAPIHGPRSAMHFRVFHEHAVGTVGVYRAP